MSQNQTRARLATRFLVAGLLFAASIHVAAGHSAAEPPVAPNDATLAATFAEDILPVLARYCHECHSGDRTEAEIDFAAFSTLADVRRGVQVWQKVREMLDSDQMPPPDADQPTADERATLAGWVGELLRSEARAKAGDPGRVVLRRLSNVEYTYTLRDLTGVAALDPARQFPVDSAAGEGFTNVGNSLVMSPALLSKYLDAAKEVAGHAVLLPDGLRFSPHVTRRDWTNELLDEIRDFYARYSGTGGGTAVNLQGIEFDTNQGGLLPLEAYLTATLEERDALATGQHTIEAVAAERKLSAKYLGALWQALTAAPTGDSLPLDSVRAAWRSATPDDVPVLAGSIGGWQRALWKFNTIGHIGREGGPPSWMEPVSPIVSRQEFRLKLTPPAAGEDVVVYLAAGDAGDGQGGANVLWGRPRLVAPGRPDLLLRDVRNALADLAKRRDRYLAHAARCLDAAAEAQSGTSRADMAALAATHEVDADSLTAWFDYLGIRSDGPTQLGTPIVGRAESSSGYDFVKGWVGDAALSVVANSSDQHVRIPGNMLPHSVAVHPTPSLGVAVGWRSPVAAGLRVSGTVQHAHPECGNGVVWSVELRRGNTRQVLASGASERATVIPIGPIEAIAVQIGDTISLVIGPRDGDHSCDLTAIDLTLHDGQREWNLAREVSPDILAGNPHADSFGNADVWYFYSEPVAGGQGHVIPAGSLLAKWQSAASADERRQLAGELQTLLRDGPGSPPADSPDATLHRQLTSLAGPLMTVALGEIASPQIATPSNESVYGLDPAAFGRHPNDSAIDPAGLCVRAPAVIEVRLPAELVAGAELVASGVLLGDSAGEAGAQLQVSTTRPDVARLAPGAPIVAAEGTAASRRLEAAFDEFRNLFPPALCYPTIVPVDEVVTLTLYFREDHQFVRLMCDESEAAELNRLWDELLFVAREPLELVISFDQISEFATQDRPDLVTAFAPLKQPIYDRAAAFEQRQIDCGPAQLDAVLRFANDANRRPLTDVEAAQLRNLYANLRAQELPHDEAIRLVLARVLVAPAFLYRLEMPGHGAAAAPVTDWELATRLSYFLWSSQPDDELRRLAATGELTNPEVLAAQTRRMLGDPKTRRLATEFACQWLHIRDFDKLDEKSERHFPTFAALRGDMYEESILFFTDLFQNDRSILDILDADHAFLNEALAEHYGIAGVAGPEWRRVDGVRQFARGGILAQASTLSKLSGASRTSPILRGDWLSEVILGQKLPKPPKDVPVLADAVPDGLTERQLIERHTSDPACAKCHARFDPFGYALESYDAIGRFREYDAGGLAIDASTSLPDGTRLEGSTGLRDYLVNQRRPDFVRQFNRKLLGFALGRSVQLSDEPLLDELDQILEQNGYRFAPLIESIVASRQFREIRGREFVEDEL